ncbi:response regulator, partial [Micromonospora sp. NPDC000018]
VSPYGTVDALRGARILVADDNADMRAYLARLLAGQGWRVETVGDGRQALAAIRREQPDLVLADVMMPEVDGFELLRRLRQQADTRALPVVVLSARAGGDASVEGLDLGADDYVVKPFAAGELIARIRATLHGARARGHHRAEGLLDAAGAEGRGGCPERGPVTSSGSGDGLPTAGAGVAGSVGAGVAGSVGAPDDPTGATALIRPATPGVADTAVGSAPHPQDGQQEPAPALGTALDTGWTYPSRPTSASAMRRDVRTSLEAMDVDPDIMQDLLLAASEAVNNAVEHAQRPTRPEVRVRLRVADGTVRISVRDFGTWRDRRPAMDRGRGATLMNAYGDVRMVSTAEGTTVTIERRLPPAP